MNFIKLSNQTAIFKITTRYYIDQTKLVTIKPLKITKDVMQNICVSFSILTKSQSKT